ncbi:MAG: endonuclease/exonuclease/phosphatase family protein [Saccharofermentans sp.]|nr:endonuclease/exonuclease/phosphatase family protein [Saccharofermentans sp.]
MKIVKGVLKTLLVIVLVLVVLLAALLIWLTVVEYRPEAEENVAVCQLSDATDSLSAGDQIKIVAWNIGYGALGDNADFFMDGGKMVYTADEDRVKENLNAIISEVKAQDPDILLLQEIDLNSDRSYHIDETKYFDMPGYNNYAFANNFKVAYAPFPVPPMGSINSGIATYSCYPTTSATRVSLPCPFSWPIRTFNLKRCLLITRIPVEGGKELVIVNLHLEAYDDGEGKAAQAQMLMDILSSEASKGNYVIAGGDFNQSFSNVESKNKVFPEQWQPAAMDVSPYENDWQFIMTNEIPTCRSLYTPLVGNESGLQYYMIDGFILSKNISVDSYSIHDLGFANSDHNPQMLNITLN